MDAVVLEIKSFEWTQMLELKYQIVKGKMDRWTHSRKSDALLKQVQQQDLSQGQDSSPDSALPIT